ncbi:hypothetical protein J6590_048836 [Homalodisca vitripennis]|nr:hypothetical protein J6590_048836 [Homalodisca vitripennis]
MVPSCHIIISAPEALTATTCGFTQTSATFAPHYRVRLTPLATDVRNRSQDLILAHSCRDATGQGNQGSQGEKQDWKSGKSQGIRSQVREKSGNFDVGQEKYKIPLHK